MKNPSFPLQNGGRKLKNGCFILQNGAVILLFGGGIREISRGILHIGGILKNPRGILSWEESKQSNQSVRQVFVMGSSMTGWDGRATGWVARTEIGHRKDYDAPDDDAIA